MALKHFAATFAAGVSVIALAHPAQAQTDDAAASQAEEKVQPGVGEIVVTAQRRAERINEVPLSIQAFSGDTLTARGITDATDLSKLVTGFSFSDSAFAAPIYTLRGVGFSDGSLASTSTVAIYQDEVPLPYPAMTRGAMLDVQRVEVLKGPQGTLYGQNSTGGAINYIANRPTEELSGKFLAEYGRFDTIRAEAAMSGAIAPGVRVRIAANTLQSGDWQRSITRNDTLGAQHRSAGRFLLDWDASETFTVSLNLNGWVDRSDTQAPQLVKKIFSNAANIPVTPSATVNAPLIDGTSARDADWAPGVDYARDDNFFQAALTLGADLGGGIDFKSISAYSRYRTDSMVNRSGMASIDLDTRFQGKINSRYQELRLSGGSEPFTWIVGGNYRNDDLVDHARYLSKDATNAIAVGIPYNGSQVNSDQSIKALGIFANADYDLTNTVALNLGMRYSSERQHFVGCNYDPGTNDIGRALTIIANALRAGQGLPPLATAIPAGGCMSLDANLTPNVADLRLKEGNFAFRGALTWKPSNDVLAYASISRGYKSGAFATIPATSHAQFAPAKQEEVMAYEIGTKLTLADRKVQFNTALFYYDYTDKQLRGRRLEPVFGPLGLIVNIPKSRVWGIEADVAARPVDGLNLNASVMYLNTKIKEFTGINNSGQTENFAGSPFNFSPKWQINGGFEYAFQSAGDIEPFVGADVTYRSSTGAFFGTSQDYNIDAYTLLDLRAGIRSRDHGWSASIWAKNVTNTYYWTNVTRGNDTVARSPAMPATYGATLSYSF